MPGQQIPGGRIRIRRGPAGRDRPTSFGAGQFHHRRIAGRQALHQALEAVFRGRWPSVSLAADSVLDAMPSDTLAGATLALTEALASASASEGMGSREHWLPHGAKALTAASWFRTVVEAGRDHRHHSQVPAFIGSPNYRETTSDATLLDRVSCRRSTSPFPSSLSLIPPDGFAPTRLQQCEALRATAGRLSRAILRHNSTGAA